MSKSILESLRAAHYKATDEQVESLAALAASGQKAGNTYLSVLVAHVRHAINKAKTKRAGKNAQLGAIDKVQEHLYPHILKGVAPDSVEQDERNRLAIFARTAASDLRFFVKSGGDVRKLEPGEVRKHELRKEGQDVPTGTRAERAFSKANETLASSARRIARTDPNEALARIRSTMAALEELADEIEHAEKPAKRAAKAKTKAPRITPPVSSARALKTPASGEASQTTFG